MQREVKYKLSEFYLKTQKYRKCTSALFVSDNKLVTYTDTQRSIFIGHKTKHKLQWKFQCLQNLTVILVQHLHSYHRNAHQSNLCAKAEN